MPVSLAWNNLPLDGMLVHASFNPGTEFTCTHDERHYKSLVQELIIMARASVRATQYYSEYSTFTIWSPYLPVEKVSVPYDNNFHIWSS